MQQTAPHRSVDPLNSCLKWRQDGELSELDLNRILELLSQVDPVAEAFMGDRTDG
jgi:hypothetical protein